MLGLGFAVLELHALEHAQLDGAQDVFGGRSFGLALRFGVVRHVRPCARLVHLQERDGVEEAPGWLATCT